MKLFIKICIYVFSFIIFLSVLLTLPLRWFNPPVTAFTLKDENIQSLNLRKTWTAYEDVSPQVFLAIIASEDQKFPDHFGIDYESLKKALNEKRNKPRGASTITQQLIKNLYLWSGRSIVRKAIEAWLTIWIELLVDKKRILELYVNVVEFGPGLYGITNASEQFYSVSPKQLNKYQAAMLAAVLPNPKRLSVAKPSNYIYERSASIRAYMNALGGIGFLNKM